MNTPLRLYTVRIVRQAGQYTLTGEAYEYAEQTVKVNANNRQAAYQYARSVCTLRFFGHPARVSIDGVDYNVDECI